MAKNARAAARRAVGRGGIIGIACLLIFGSATLMAAPGAVSTGLSLLPHGDALVRDSGDGMGTKLTAGPAVAGDDQAEVDEDSSRTVIPVTDNDNRSGPNSIVAKTDGHHGFVHIKQHSSTVTYTPHPNYCNTRPGRPKDTFTYTIVGGATATVTVTVDCEDDPPVVTPGPGRSYVENDAPPRVNSGLALLEPDGEGLRSATLSITSGYVAGQDHLLWHDNDPTDAITLDPSSTDATIKLVGTGRPTRWRTALRAVRYENSSDTPNTSPRTVTISVTDAAGSQDARTAALLVAAFDDPPIAVDDTATVAQNSSATTIAVLANDTDPEGDPITITAAGGAAHGAVAIGNSSTDLTYAPTGGYCNTHAGDQPDSFTYKLNGGATATVRVTVTCSDAAETPSGSGRRRRREAARRRPGSGQSPSDQAPVSPPPVTPIPLPAVGRLAIAHRVVIARSGTTSVGLRCGGPVNPARCLGTIRIEATSLHSRRPSARSAAAGTGFTLVTGKKTSVKLKLPAATRAQLRAHRRAVVRSVVRLSDGTTVTRLLTVISHGA